MRESLSCTVRHLVPARWAWSLLVPVLLLAACQPQAERADTATTPPVGHYEGTITPAGQPAVRAALDIRHPSPGHYEAELTTPSTGSLSFVADTIVFVGKQMRLKRPARPSQTLTLTLEGDFWRGTLQLDSLRAETLLLKRGMPTPSTYRVEELPEQNNRSAWLFSPADTGTPGPALVLLPDAAMGPVAAIWADALAREGIIVLVLPALDSATTETEAPRLHGALGLLRNTPGADTANVGAWACGSRAGTLAQLLANPSGTRPAFIVAQNAEIDAVNRAAFREVRRSKIPVLGLHGGKNASSQATALRNALGGSRGAPVRAYRGTGPDLLVPGALGSAFGTGLPDDVLKWLRSR